MHHEIHQRVKHRIIHAEKIHGQLEQFKYDKAEDDDIESLQPIQKHDTKMCNLLSQRYLMKNNIKQDNEAMY